MKKTSCFLAVIMLFLLVGCEKQPENKKITLQGIISTENIDFSDRNTELSIDFSCNYNNTYKNTVLNFYNTLDEYIITKTENTHNYDDEGIYISFMSFDYKDVAFEIYEDDIIRISKNHGLDNEYYKCNGIYNAVKNDIAVLTNDTGKYYTIHSDEFLNTYTIFDIKGNIIFEETTSEYPNIYIVDENTIVNWIQYGTGTLTRCAYFYNHTTGEISKMIQGQIDWYNGYVCNSMSGAVCVQQIFGSDEIWIYNNFEQKIADYIENINSVRFISDGKQIEVTYWTENSTEPTTQIFDVDKPDRITTYEEL